MDAKLRVLLAAEALELKLREQRIKEQGQHEYRQRFPRQRRYQGWGHDGDYDADPDDGWPSPYDLPGPFD